MVSVFVVLIFTPATAKSMHLKTCQELAGDHFETILGRVEQHKMICKYETLHSAITDLFSATRLTFLIYSIHINKEQNR